MDAVNAGKSVLKLFVCDGWNLISSPYTGWQVMSSLAAAESRTLLACVGGVYQPLAIDTPLVPGHAYWLQLRGIPPEGKPIVIAGYEVADPSIPFVDGWNLVGPIVETATDTLDWARGRPWTWDVWLQRLIRSGDVLELGCGYWGYLASVTAYVGRLSLNRAVFDHAAGTVTFELGEFNGDTLLVRFYDVTRDRLALDTVIRDLGRSTRVSVSAADGLTLMPETQYSIQVCAVRNGVRGAWVRAVFFSGAAAVVDAAPFDNTDIRQAGFDWGTRTLTNLYIGADRIEYKAARFDAAGNFLQAQEPRVLDSADAPLDLNGLGAQDGDVVYVMVRIVDAATGEAKSDWRTFSR